MAKRAKANDNALDKLGHVVVDGKCSACKRVGGDLKIACPGYPTAGDVQAEQCAKRGRPQHGPVLNAKKGGRR